MPLVVALPVVVVADDGAAEAAPALEASFVMIIIEWFFLFASFLDIYRTMPLLV